MNRIDNIMELTMLLLSCISVGVLVTGAQIDAPVSDVNVPFDCESDRDCPESSYCFQVRKDVKNAVCIACFDCSTRNRQNRIRCAQDVLDCGECLPGFVSESFSRRWCREEKIINIAQAHSSADTDVSVNIKWITLFLFCCLFMVLGFTSYYCYSNKRRNVNVSNSLGVNELNTRYYHTTTTTASNNVTRVLPPPYRESEDFCEEDVSCSFELRIVEQSVNDRQKAVPCFLHEISSAVTGNVQQSAENSASHVVTPYVEQEQEITTGGSEAPGYSFQIHDESTTPSFWTPGESYGNAAPGNEETNEERLMQASNKRKRVEDCDKKKKQKGG